MLKPTVGMELWPSISAWTNQDGTYGCAKHRMRTWTKQVDAGLRDIWRTFTYSTVNSPPWRALVSAGSSQEIIVDVAHANFPNGEPLTARTLSSDVLPAFCSPIMVMSISVAL